MIKTNFDIDVYNKAVQSGYIKTQVHPDAPYTIHNYTDSCTWDQAWDEATLNCRGLITDDRTGEIVARGMPKFFNSDQEQAPKFALDDEVHVREKMDGSLGILYKLPDGSEAIATRGSFTSEQALWATKWWNENRPSIENLKPDPLVEDGYFSMDNWTFVFEIIYPENRIVVDYNGFEGLFLLGAVRNSDGLFQPLNVPDVMSARTYEYKTWGDVLAAPERTNAEGFVVTRISDAAMVKVKYEDYKRLHKYMTRVTERHVWECLVEDRDLEKEFQGAPDEFHYWIRNVVRDLEEKFEDRHIKAILAYRKIRFGEQERLFEVEDPREAKKNFALAIKDEKDKSLYFCMFENRTTIPQIWKELKPEAKTFKKVSSDAD